MYPRRSKVFPQLPPTWSSWLAAFKVLVENGASVHEINFDRSLATLDITHGGPGSNPNYEEPNAVEYFKILHDQCFYDFTAFSKGNWSALLTAIRRRTRSVETLQFLSQVKVDFEKLASTGQSSLHWAAEMALEPRCLEYLCTTSAFTHLNRQDK